MSDKAKTIMRDATKVVFGCLGISTLFVVAVALLLMGVLQYLDHRDKAAIAKDLPEKLEIRKIQSLDVCSRVFGGYSFVAEIPASVSQKIKREGLVFFQNAVPSKDIQGDYEWKSASTLPPPDEFSRTGLSCLSKENKAKYRIFNGFDPVSQSYYVSVHPRGALYVIPRLNVVIGGFDAR